MKANRRAKNILQTLPKDVRAFLEEVDNELIENNFTLYISSGKSVKNDCGKCGGYFCSVNKILAVAANNDLSSFISLLCHEYCHYLHFRDKKSVWHDEKINSQHSKFFYWLNGEKHYKSEELCQAAIKLELDCERRALKLIRRKFSHVISPADYCKNANAYLFGYLWVHQTGEWFKKELYHPEILAACEPILKRKYTKIPEKLEAAFKKFL